MSMEISNRYEDHYLDRVQLDRQEKGDEIAKNGEKENKTENIPTPKDEYISSEKSGMKPSGLYHMGQDADGNPKVIYDDPEKVKEGKDAKAAEEPANNAEKTTTNTDKVDMEIEKLKEEKKQLEQQIRAANGDEKKIKELQKKLAQIEGELSQKDNDTYRRQNAVIS